MYIYNVVFIHKLKNHHFLNYVARKQKFFLFIVKIVNIGQTNIQVFLTHNFSNLNLNMSQNNTTENFIDVKLKKTLINCNDKLKNYTPPLVRKKFKKGFEVCHSKALTSLSVYFFYIQRSWCNFKNKLRCCGLSIYK